MGTRNTDPDTKPLKIEDKKPVQKIDESKDLAKIINDKKDIVQRYGYQMYRIQNKYFTSIGLVLK